LFLVFSNCFVKLKSAPWICCH